MDFLRNEIEYEDAEGEHQEKTVYTQDGSGTELTVDSDGDLIVTESVTLEGHHKQEGELQVLYIPKHRLVSVESKVIEG